MYAIDGLVPSGSSNFFHSDLEDHPWFQLDLIGATVVKGVTITNRKNCCGDRFQNVSINVGDEPAVPGDLVTNPKCAIFEGPSATGRIERIMCTEPLVGRYLQVQLRGSSPSILQINEIKVIKPTTTDTATGNFLQHSPLWQLPAVAGPSVKSICQYFVMLLTTNCTTV
jgi:hypothetical protein